MKKITLEELRCGMCVLRFDKEGVPYSYYAHGLPLSMVASARKALLEYGVKFAFIREESAPSPDVLANKIINPPPKKTPTSSGISFEDIIAAQKIHIRARQITKDVLSEVRLGVAVNTETSKTVVSELIDSCLKNPDAFVNMTRLKDFDDYTFTHSVNVSILAVSIGRRLGMSVQELENLGLAALLHDVGKMRVPEHILNKPGKLTDEEFLVMRQHPVYSYELLKNDRSIPPEVVKAVRQHHEKSDGSGYPDGIKESDISKYAKILAISDVYDAITSERVYHKGMMAIDALKILFSWSGKHFNEVLVKFFINLIGIYPAGTAIMLDNGELGVVVSTNKEDGTRPKIIIITDENRNMLSEPYFFDLMSYNVTTGRPYKNILAPVNTKEFNIDSNKIISEFVNA